MSDEVPQAMDDRDWEQFARAPNVLRRVNLLRYLAAKEISIERKSRADQATAEFNDEMTRLAAAKFADGEMVYWPGFHELIRSPAFYQKAMNHVSGSRMWASMRDGLLPAVLIDMQCFERARDDERNLLGRQVIRAIQHNYLHRIPLPLTIADYDTSKPGATKLNEMHCFPFNGDCDREAFMPTYTAQSVVELYSNRQRDVIYITPYATVAFAGPLNEADVYVVLATKNRHNETLAVCRRECFRARRLPIAEYFSWRQGTSQNLPIDVTLRILHEVALNGGDWKTAMLNNITRRNLLPEEERSEEERAVSFLRREKWKQKQEIIARLKQFSQES